LSNPDDYDRQTNRPLQEHNLFGVGDNYHSCRLTYDVTYQNLTKPQLTVQLTATCTIMFNKLCYDNKISFYFLHVLTV